MVFSDLFFLFVFLPAFAALYGIAALLDGRKGSCRIKNAVLVLFSLIFYAWGEPVYVFLMLGCVLMNYMSGLAVEKWKNHRKLALAAGVGLDIAVLGVFKYAAFFCNTLCSCGLDVPVPRIALPIGISFYIFQSISYLVDVYRGEVAVQKNFSRLLLYISMFPQLIAGPIVRYGTVAEETRRRHVSLEDVSEGIFRFIIGLGKKVIIANQLGEIATQFLGPEMQHPSVAGSWTGLLAFTLQIYFDFSGYSDMAIGIGRCIGFHFKENFDHPYCSRSITEFWRRWHMSLGSFFKDYVYIPLGGNRRHQAFNILFVWFLTGMWHGASWNFIIWGIYFGLWLMLEKFVLKKFLDRIPGIFGHIYTLAVVIFSFAIFYFEDMNEFSAFVGAAFAGTSAPIWDFVVESAFFSNFYLWILAVLCCLPLGSFIRRFVSNEGVLAVMRIILCLFILIVSVSMLVGATNNAFLYTRF